LSNKAILLTSSYKRGRNVKKTFQRGKTFRIKRTVLWGGTSWKTPDETGNRPREEARPISKRRTCGTTPRTRGEKRRKEKERKEEKERRRDQGRGPEEVERARTLSERRKVEGTKKREEKRKRLVGRAHRLRGRNMVLITLIGISRRSRTTRSRKDNKKKRTGSPNPEDKGATENKAGDARADRRKKGGLRGKPGLVNAKSTSKRRG